LRRLGYAGGYAGSVVVDEDAGEEACQNVRKALGKRGRGRQIGGELYASGHVDLVDVSGGDSGQGLWPGHLLIEPPQPENLRLEFVPARVGAEAVVSEPVNSELRDVQPVRGAERVTGRSKPRRLAVHGPRGPRRRGAQGDAGR